MLKKKNRLTTKEFEEVFKKGKKFFSDNFMLISLKQDGEKKVSVSISKKNAKKAIQRVFSRRVIYRILKDNFDLVPDNFLFVLIITKPILNKDKKELEKEIRFLFKG